MPLVSDRQVEDALAILADEEGAAARAAAEYLNDLTKGILSELMMRSNETSAAAKEMWARSQPEYREHLIRVGAAAKLDFQWRQRYSAAAAKIDCWRTEQSNIRASERVR